MLKFVRRSTLVRVMVGLCTIALTSGAALASHIPADPFSFPTPFIVNPSAVATTPVGAPKGPFDVLRADFSYVGEIDQTATGAATSSFTETGFAPIGSFRFPTVTTIVPASTSGLNVDYNLYLKFAAEGTVAFNAGLTGVDGTFTSFTLEVWVDPELDTTGTPPVPGPPSGGITLVGAGEDILVASTLGNGLVNGFGGFHLFTGLAGGDFDVIVTLFDLGLGFFVWPGGLPSAVVDLNGVFSSLGGPFGPPGTSFTDAINDGSGNISVAASQIPEPSTLLLLGTGLGIVGLVSRWRLKRNV